MSCKKSCFLEKLITFVSQYDFKDGEIIREITNYNSKGRYYVSNYGNIITLYYNKWRLIKPSKDKDGYLFVSLWHKDHRIHKGIHQLVAESFLDNPAPTVKAQIHHIDFDPLNNKACNLMYVSPKEHRAIHDRHNKEIAEKRIKNYGNSKNS